MRVMLIAHTTVVNNIPGYTPHTLPDIPAAMDDLGEQAGRLCYLAWFRKNPDTATNRGYLRNILRKKHYSVIEHSSASFYIDGVSRAFLLELERHRHLSYSVVSQRYVDGSEFSMTEHPELKKLSFATKVRIKALYKFTQILYRDIVAELLALDPNPKKNVKAARGAARMVLPEGTETKILVSGNLRAWQEILWKRLSPEADAEICEVSKLILEELKKLAPNTFQDFE